MIAEIEKIDGYDNIQFHFGNGVLSERVYQSYPLFKYLIPVADKIDPAFWVDEVIDGGDGEVKALLPSTCPDVFAKRYIEGHIDTSFKEKFESADELLATLEGFGIEKDAFWYLILFIKDFVEGQINGAGTSNTAKQDLEEIRDAFKGIDANKWLFSQFLLNKQDILPTGDIKLIVKIDKHNYEYDNKVTLKTLAFCIDQMLEYMHEGTNFCDAVNHLGFEDNPAHYYTNDQNVSLYVSSKKYRENIVYRQYLFTKYLMGFLESYKKGDKQVARINGHQVGISYDKMLLISRVIYIIGYTSKPDDRRFYDEWNEEGTKKNNILKNNLRKYGNVTIHTSNAYYSH